MTDDPSIHGSQVPGRSCDGCTLCCKLVAVEPLNKPRDKWCTHCDIGKGCRIYETRPEPCRIFRCGYLLTDQMAEHWRPARARMVVLYDGNANRVFVFTDPARPGVWRSEPYRADINEWAKTAAANGGQVLVMAGPNTIALLPDREIDLGVVGPGQLIVTVEKQNAPGVPIDVVVVDRDNPTVGKYGIDLAGVDLPQGTDAEMKTVTVQARPATT